MMFGSMDNDLTCISQSLEEKVEYWMEKHEKDVEQKDKELNILKASKAKDLERLNELTKLVQCLLHN